MTRAGGFPAPADGDKAVRYWAASNLAQQSGCCIILKFACPNSGAAHFYS